MKSTSTRLFKSTRTTFHRFHFLYLMMILFQATILQSIFVFVDSFQLNKNFNAIAVMPRNFRNVDFITTTRTTSPFTSTNYSSCEKSGLEYLRFSNNNKNDSIRLYSTPLSENETKENDNNAKTNKKKKQKSTQQQRETIPSKIILQGKKTKSLADLKQKESRRTWEDSYELLKQYKEQHGDCMVPQQYDQDKKLGIWVNTQRQQAKKGQLNPERKNKLDEIGFNWDAKIDNWNLMLEQLKEFQEEFGHCSINQNIYKSRQALAIWVETQRHRRPLLTNEQRSHLDELGFVWEDVQKARGDRQWEERFEALQDYQRMYGHTRVPHNAFHKNVKLGLWAYTQRQNYRKGTLRKDREDKLNSIGFIWKLRDVNSTDYKKVNKIWMKNLEKLKDFKMIYNHTIVPQKYEEDPKLGLWVYNQRRNYRLGTLKKIRQEMLESIGFEWNPQEQAFEQQWMDLYQDLVVFQRKHGHVDVPRGSYPSLYKWLYRQRTYFANKRLESERKELLEKLGVNLNVGPGSGSTMLD